MQLCECVHVCLTEKTITETCISWPTGFQSILMVNDFYQHRHSSASSFLTEQRVTPTGQMRVLQYYIEEPHQW